MYVIEFAPPMTGFEGRFNTVRLGGTWGRRVKGGDRVLLLDKRVSAVFGTAEVEQVVVGRLNELAPAHAEHNHNQKGLDAQGAPERLVAGMKKRYGPQKVRDNSLVTFVYLRLLDEKQGIP